MLGTVLVRFVAVTIACVGATFISIAQLPADATAVQLPSDSAVFAKLTANLDLALIKTGDTIESQTIEDVKVGNEVVIKKGSIISGHVSNVEQPQGSQTDTMVGILIDGVTTKHSPVRPVKLLIRAVAPPLSEQQNSTLAEGRGMPGATTAATVPGNASAGGTGGRRLSASSLGVSGYPAIHLGSRKDSKGTPMTVFAVSKGDANLKKGTQLLFKSPVQ